MSLRWWSPCIYCRLGSALVADPRSVEVIDHRKNEAHGPHEVDKPWAPEGLGSKFTWLLFDGERMVKPICRKLGELENILFVKLDGRWWIHAYLMVNNRQLVFLSLARLAVSIPCSLIVVLQPGCLGVSFPCQWVGSSLIHITPGGMHQGD